MVMDICVENIWENFSQPLKGFIKRRVDNDQDVEDILQNVFYKIHHNLSNLNETGKVQAWVYQIARNAVADYYRTSRYAYTSYTEELPETMLSDVQEEETANEDIAQCLKTMVQDLPEKYKQALILTEFQQLTRKELGDRLGLSVSGAKSRVQRARGMLKEMLLDCCHLEFDRLGNVIDYQHKCSDCKYC